VFGSPANIRQPSNFNNNYFKRPNMAQNTCFGNERKTRHTDLSRRICRGARDRTRKPGRAKPWEIKMGSGHVRNTNICFWDQFVSFRFHVYRFSREVFVLPLDSSCRKLNFAHKAVPYDPCRCLGAPSYDHFKFEIYYYYYYYYYNYY
jgi:hypothetical protein